MGAKDIMLAIHILCGFVALVTMVMAYVTNKGPKFHAKVGRKCTAKKLMMCNGRGRTYSDYSLLFSWGMLPESMDVKAVVHNSMDFLTSDCILFQISVFGACRLEIRLKQKGRSQSGRQDVDSVWRPPTLHTGGSTIGYGGIHERAAIGSDLTSLAHHARHCFSFGQSQIDELFSTQVRKKKRRVSCNCGVPCQNIRSKEEVTNPRSLALAYHSTNLTGYTWKESAFRMH